MKKLANLFIEHAALPLYKHTQNLIGLIGPDGSLLECNPALNHFRATWAATTLQELLTPASQTLFFERLQAGEISWARMDLKNWAIGCSFNSLILPLPDELFLCCLEPVYDAHKAEVAQLKQQLTTTKQALELKQLDLESVLAQANEVSHTDSLTCLPNRRQIVADLQREVILCQSKQKPLTIFMLDLDHFKHVNDTYGHPAGDQVLRALAGKLQTSIRETDKLGRYGGEEFLMLLPGASLKSAIQTAERLLELTRGLVIQVGPEVELQVTLSLGIAQHQADLETWEELLKRADAALYQAKTAGRDQWAISQIETLAA